MINPLSLGLRFCARNGRWILVASLVVGLLSQSVALLVKPHIGFLIVLLLFAASLRVGPRAAIGAASDIKFGLVFVVILQIAAPLALIVVASVFQFDGPLIFALIMLMAAPSLSGSPHLVVLMGFEPSPALRQLLLGTALLPLTIVPVFLLLPEFGALSTVLMASFRLLAVILIVALAAFVIRATIMRHPSTETIERLDGASTILLAIVVVGLMTAIRAELTNDPVNLLITLVAAIAANLGTQVVAAAILARSIASAYTVPVGVISGNRNVALFLAALPASAVEPLMLFIGCYQIPMYLTPLVMRRYYRWISPSSAADQG